MNKSLKTLALVAAVSALLAAGLIGFDYFETRDRFPNPTFIGAANVSGLSEKEAVEKLSRLNISAVYAPAITFEAEDHRFTFSPEAVGIRINYKNTVRHAYSATHREGYLEELRERLKKEELVHALAMEVDGEQLSRVIESLAAEIRSSARDASIELFEDTGGYHIEPEDIGREVKTAATMDEFNRRLMQGNKVFPVSIAYTYPKITEKMLREYPPVYRLSGFTTYYGRHDSPNRIHNIKLIASWLDGTMLMPGDAFSLADSIGDFTPERGFKEAFVIYGGVLVPQLGGGTCQIGTTLFNAISLADLELLQRQNHSFYFNIYPLGRDATVYPGQKDLKFRNNTGHPALIKAVATNRRLSFRVYGTPTGKSVKFSNPSVFILTEAGYKPATVRQVLDADRPFRTIVTRTVFDAAGKQIMEEKLISHYKLYGEKSNVPIARPEPR